MDREGENAAEPVGVDDHRLIQYVCPRLVPMRRSHQWWAPVFGTLNDESRSLIVSTSPVQNSSWSWAVR